MCRNNGVLRRRRCVPATGPAVDRVLRQGRLWIRRSDSATYDVMIRPSGNGDYRITTEESLRMFLWDAAIPLARIDEAIAALRTHAEHEILNLRLSVDRMRALGL
jgi:hypothetical protein